MYPAAPALTSGQTIIPDERSPLPRVRNHMSIFWLRVALAFYGVGLLYALVALTRTSDLLNRVALQAAYLGMVLHAVSLAEGVFLSDHVTLAMVHNSESVLAFLIMAVFMIMYLVYKTTSPGIIVFPLVFLLTFMAATRQQPFLLMSPGMRTSWLFAHIGLIFTGYAALFLSFCASVLYLIQQHLSRPSVPPEFCPACPRWKTLIRSGTARC